MVRNKVTISMDELKEYNDLNNVGLTTKIVDIDPVVTIYYAKHVFPVVFS